jgi:hypothetical protein
MPQPKQNETGAREQSSFHSMLQPQQSNPIQPQQYRTNVSSNPQAATTNVIDPSEVIRKYLPIPNSVHI